MFPEKRSALELPPETYTSLIEELQATLPLEGSLEFELAMEIRVLFPLRNFDENMRRKILAKWKKTLTLPGVRAPGLSATRRVQIALADTVELIAPGQIRLSPGASKVGDMIPLPVRSSL